MQEHILRIICNHYQLTKELLSTKEQRRQPMNIVNAKQVAAYFLWELTQLSNADIARMLGYNNRHIIQASRRRVKKISEGNRAFSEELTTLRNSIIRH